MKTAKEWAARIQGDRTTPWAELVKMIQDDALSTAESLVGRCVEVGTDDDGQARLLIHTTQEQLMNFGRNLAYADVEVTLHNSGLVDVVARGPIDIAVDDQKVGEIASGTGDVYSTTVDAVMGKHNL